MKAGAVRARGATNTAVAAMLYLLCAAGTLLFLSRSYAREPGLPDLYRGAPGFILAILPAASLALFLIMGAAMLKQRGSRVWGARLRLRLSALVLGTALAGFLPASLVYASMAARAASTPSSRAVSQAVDGGVALALRYYRDMDQSLEALAERELPALLAQAGPDAAALLERLEARLQASLQARQASVASVELFLGGVSLSAAGTAVARPSLEGQPDATGFLPRLSAGGLTYIRYHKTSLAGGLSASVALALDPEVDEAAAALSRARVALRESGRLAGSTVLYALAFGLSLAFPLLVLAMAASRSMAEGLLEPLSALDSGIKAVAGGERRLPYLSKPDDETGQLVASFNAMLTELERSRGDELRNERLVAWRDIARRLAHELRNPLTPIRLTAERVLKRWKADPDSLGDILEKSMVAIIQETAGMETLLSEFRDFARLPEPQSDWVELRSLAEETAHLYSAQWPSLALDLSGVPPGITVRADRGQLKQALGNLLSNAADATGGRGRVAIRANLVKAAECLYCRIQVSDDGQGIAKELGNQVFTPYFSTKPQGTGLGLAIVEHIASSHGGRVWFDSAPGSGTTFYVDIPALAAKEP